MSEKVIIAGGGIAGLSLALSLHQIGVDCVVFESVDEIKPLGVGINLQPNAVRELYEMGLDADAMNSVGIPAKEWALVGLNGKDIYSEPRGTLAGYNWPQYAAHRGKFHQLLYRLVVERLGADAVQLGQKVIAYQELSPESVEVVVRHRDGSEEKHLGAILLGADGIHSSVRAQMHPQQPPVNWGGILMWRGTTRMAPMRTGSSFVGLGSPNHRMVIYPISEVGDDGLADVNWIAELVIDGSDGWQQKGWFKPVPAEDFVHLFEDFTYDWLDVPSMINQSKEAYVNPMIDRDPISFWTEGPVGLMGDAAHAMYPTGSNGASQAIIDARVLTAKIREHGVNTRALKSFEEELIGPVNELVLRNRSAGPFGLLNIVDERCGGVFDNIDEVISAEERNSFMANYKKAAGFAIQQLNNSPAILPMDDG